MKTSKTEKVVFPLDIRTKTEKRYSEEKRRISVCFFYIGKGH